MDDPIVCLAKVLAWETETRVSCETCPFKNDCAEKAAGKNVK